jgi:hypothetical protein
MFVEVVAGITPSFIFTGVPTRRIKNEFNKKLELSLQHLASPSRSIYICGVR